MLCMTVAQNGPRVARLYSLSGLGFDETRLEPEHYVSYTEWALGYTNQNGDFTEVVRFPAS